MSYTMIDPPTWKKTINGAIACLDEHKTKDGEYPFDSIIGAGRSGGVVGAVLAFQLGIQFFYYGHPPGGEVPADRRPGCYPLPNNVTKCRASLFVDDCITGGKTFRSVQKGLLSIPVSYKKDERGNYIVKGTTRDKYGYTRHEYELQAPEDRLFVKYILEYGSPPRFYPVTEHPSFKEIVQYGVRYPAKLRFPGDEVCYGLTKPKAKVVRDKLGRFAPLTA